MNPCSIDWTAFAAWVQAIGSIAAIGVAIGLSKKQHNQNIELVENERQRNKEESARIERAERLALKEVVFIPLDSLMSFVIQKLEELESYKSKTEPLPESIMQKIYDIEMHADITIKQFLELRDAFIGHPRNLLVHSHLIAALTNTKIACNQQKDLNNLRISRQSQINQSAFNGTHVQIIAEQPFDIQNIIDALKQLQKVFKTVGV
jgi:hypothetical protein